jgi:hypothetical protein
MADQYREPVRFSFTAELVDAPKDVQAIWACQQVLDHLELTPEQRRNVLRFLEGRVDV